MKINYSGIIAEEQCMKAGSWLEDEPVAHINVVKRLITQVNEAKEESADLRMQVDVMSTRVDARTLALEAENQKLRELLEEMLKQDPYVPDYHLFRNKIINQLAQLTK